MAKRILTAILCMLLTASAIILPVSAKETEAFFPGDLNGDEQCTAIDYVALKRHVLGTYVLPESAMDAADLDRDGDVNAKDYMILKRVILGTYKLPEVSETPEEEEPSDALMAAVTLTVLLKNGSEEELLYLKSKLNMESDLLNSLIVSYLASLSVDGETLLELESEVELTLENAEEIEAFAASLADAITEWIVSMLNQ